MSMGNTRRGSSNPRIINKVKVVNDVTFNKVKYAKEINKYGINYYFFS